MNGWERNMFFEDTQIKSGIIGEVGCSWPLNDNERKVLRASAIAQKFTGAPMLILSLIHI